jgi:hypothetical protein
MKDLKASDRSLASLRDAMRSCFWTSFMIGRSMAIVAGKGEFGGWLAGYMPG